jgi:hypothetical protein
VVEGNGLENRRIGNSTEGSNPSLSAKMCVIMSHGSQDMYGGVPKWLKGTVC